MIQAVMRSLLVILPALALAFPACSKSRSKKHDPAPDDEKQENETPLPAPGEPMGETPTHAFLEKRICAKHEPPCRFVTLEHAGDTRPMVVMGEDDDDDDDQADVGEDHDEPAHDQLHVVVVDVDPVSQDADDEDHDEYEPSVVGPVREYWLAKVTEVDGTRYLAALDLVYRGQTLDADGPGDWFESLAQHQEGATIDVGNNRFTVTTASMGRIGIMGEESVSYQLSPLQQVESQGTSDSGDYSSTSSHGYRTLWRSLRSFHWDAVVLCSEPDADADADEYDEPSYLEDDEEVVYYSYVTVPDISLPAAYKRGGWRTTAMDGCSLRLDPDEAILATDLNKDRPGLESFHGFVIHGAPGDDGPDAVPAAPTSVAAVTPDAPDSRVHAVMHGKTVYVEIWDDVWVTKKTARWYHADHLEIWLGEPVATWECYAEGQRTGKGLYQWGVELESGRVIPAYGKPTQTLTVEHQPPAPGKPARLAITLPDALNDQPMTLVYSDSDDGKGQEYLLATSEFRFGHAQFLGQSETYHGMACVLDEDKGRLVVDPSGLDIAPPISSDG